MDSADDDRKRYKDVRRQIRGLVSDFVDQCQAARTRRDVYWHLLDIGFAALAAHGGAVWETVAGMPSLLQCALGTVSQADTEVDGKLRRACVEPFLLYVADSCEHVIAPPGEGGDCVDGKNPTNDLWLFAPIDDPWRREMPFAILQIVQRSGTPRTTQEGYMRFMRPICEIALEGIRRTGAE